MAKDAKGHGSEGRGAAQVSVTRPIGYRIADIGPGGKEHNVQTGTNTVADIAHAAGVSAVGQPQFWGSIHTGRGKVFETGPHPSREAAAAATRPALAKFPRAKGFSTGYGTFGGHFDIRHESKYGSY